MVEDGRNPVEDLRGASRLVVEATNGVTSLIEQMHRTIASGPAILGRPLALPARLLTGLVYGIIRGTTSFVGTGIDRALKPFSPLLGAGVPGPEREALLAALNGVLGDHLAATSNPLATPMQLRHGGRVLELEAEALRASLPDASRRLLVLVHGSCMNDRQWRRAGHDHGAALARDLRYTPVYLRYNSGRHISTNGRDFAALLDRLVQAWPTPLDAVVIVAHSMGGLVARSACHAAERAGLGWRRKLRAVVFLGTPHHGAPLERGGSWVDVLLGVSRYSAPFARLGKIRSAGITDLRFGAVLDEHWQGRDRFERQRDDRTPLPLPVDAACYAIAGTTSDRSGGLVGDGLVPVDSALGRHAELRHTLAFPETNQWIARGVAHLDLLAGGEVYETLRGWLAAEPARGRGQAASAARRPP